MPQRKDHNYLAKLILGNSLSDEEIDQINKVVDAPSQWMSPNEHRQLYHDVNPLRADSIEVNKGNIDREIARLVHIVADEDPAIQMLLDLQKMRRKYGNIR